MKSIKLPAALLLSLTLLSWPALAQNQPAETSSQRAMATAQLSQDQIRALIRQVADKDIENDKKQNEYTYIQREEEHKLDSKGEVKSSESKTQEIMVLYGEQVERLIAKNDKPLSEKDAAKEEERIQKLTDKRKHETEVQRKKRLQTEEKDREDARKFVSEVADAYNFHLKGMENLDGRETYVIDAEPRPDFQPHFKEAKVLPKFRFRAWIDQAEYRFCGMVSGANPQGIAPADRPDAGQRRSLAAPACRGQSGRAGRPAEEFQPGGRCDLPRLQEVSDRYEDRSGGRVAGAALKFSAKSSGRRRNG